MTSDRQRRLHGLVVELMGQGFTRSDAMRAVAGELAGLRAGHVAAAYWRQEREAEGKRRRAAEPVQLSLGEGS